MSSNGKPLSERTRKSIDKYSEEGMDYLQNKRTFPLGRQLRLSPAPGSDKSPAQRAIEAVDRKRDKALLKTLVRTKQESRNSDNRPRKKKAVPMPRLQSWPGSNKPKA